MARPAGPRRTIEPGTNSRLAHRLAWHKTGSALSERRSMKTRAFSNTTILFYPRNSPKMRLFALWYFTILMIIWNILGHTVLGFEQSWASPIVGIGTAIFMQM